MVRRRVNAISASRRCTWILVWIIDLQQECQRHTVIHALRLSSADTR